MAALARALNYYLDYGRRLRRRELMSRHTRWPTVMTCALERTGAGWSAAYPKRPSASPNLATVMSAHDRRWVPQPPALGARTPGDARAFELVI